MKTRIMVITLIILVCCDVGFGCTSFVLKDSNGNVSFGKNFDFPVGEGHIHLNYRNTQKTSFAIPPEIPFTWTSKYGSVTFNQAGREFPYGGMNEAGLVVEQMWLQETKYPEADDRFGLMELQWIQYQLDNAASVEEVIDSDKMVRISFMAASYLHFLVSDVSGNSATIEFIDGKMVVHQRKDLPYSVLANCPYDHSLDYKASVDNKKAKEYNEWTKNSSGRFVKAVELINAFTGTKNIIGYSFFILENVHQPNNTQWSIVYDVSNLKIHYKSALNQNKQIIDFATIDFTCLPEKPFVPIDENRSSPDSFYHLSHEANLEMIRSIINGVDLLKNTVPEEFVAASARYYDSTTCAE